MSSTIPSMPPRRRLLQLAFVVVAAIGIAAVAFVMTRQPAPPAAARAEVPPLGPFTIPPPPAEPEKQLRAELFDALGFRPGLPWGRRLDLIRALPADLTAIETDALLASLMEQTPPKVSRAIHSTYMHEIARSLQPRQAIRERFACALASLARDTKRDEVTRDYAIQHLRQVWARADADAALRGAIASTFRQFTTLDPTLSTSAVLSLHLLGSDPVNDSRTAARQIAPKSAAPPSRGDAAGQSFALPDSDLIPFLEPIFATKTTKENMPARLTAVRIAGERRIPAFRQPLLAAVKDSAEHTLVRMAAAHALGQIANPADLQALASLDPGDARVKAALPKAQNPTPAP